VPVFRGHSESVNLEFERPLPPDEARALMSDMEGVVVVDDPDRALYPMATDAAGSDAVYVGRVRADRTVPNGLALWIVSDNLRKGAALNAVQIAERLVAAAR
jgi:aspartate-semialdehyde dehydrogenase